MRRPRKYWDGQQLWDVKPVPPPAPKLEPHTTVKALEPKSSSRAAPLPSKVEAPDGAGEGGDGPSPDKTKKG
jgi:hypothetical protein